MDDDHYVSPDTDDDEEDEEGDFDPALADELVEADVVEVDNPTTAVLDDEEEDEDEDDEEEGWGIETEDK